MGGAHSPVSSEVTGPVLPEDDEDDDEDTDDDDDEEDEGGATVVIVASRFEVSVAVASTRFT